MGLGGSLRNIIRPLLARCRQPLSLQLPHEVSPPLAVASTGRASFFGSLQGSSFGFCFSTSTAETGFGFLTETWFPKRRPGMKPRRKRASLKHPGPYAWVQYVPGEPIPRSQPNEGSVKGRKQKKHIKRQKEFILSEKKKRKAQWVEARKKRGVERIERKMAAVAREKAWAQTLIELQQLLEAKKAAMA